MSYSFGCISKENVNLSWITNSIDEVRKEIDPQRIVNEYGATSGFIFSSNDYLPPEAQPENIYVKQIRSNPDGKLWIVKYLHTPNNRIDGNTLLKLLNLDNTTVKYLFYEETANWWQTSFEFKFCPPWEIEESKFVMLGVRNTDAFTQTKVGQEWIKLYGGRGNYSFLFSDRLTDLSQKTSLEESIKKVISDISVEYSQSGVLIPMDSNEIFMYESAWKKTPDKAEHAVIIHEGSTDYYVGETCVYRAVKRSLGINFKEQESSRLKFGEVRKLIID
jgi:hypothetical protein